MQRGIDVERAESAFRAAVRLLPGGAGAARSSMTGRSSSSCAFSTTNPEILLWERFWVERNKDMDRELYGIVKWCNRS